MMKIGKPAKMTRPVVVALLIAVAGLGSVVYGERAGRPEEEALSAGVAHRKRVGWRKEEVEWRGPGGRRIKAIYYPEGERPVMLKNRAGRRAVRVEERIITVDEGKTGDEKAVTRTVFANVIDSPPIDGFVPYVVVNATDEAGGWLDIDAVPESNIVGSYLTSSPDTNYAIGIFDTGASAHIVNAEDAWTIGMYEDYVTSLPITLLGATGSVDAYVSWQLAIFYDGLGAIDGGTGLLDDSNMVGQSNVSIIAGDLVESPNLPTVIGTPLAMFFSTLIENSEPISRTIDGNEIWSPSIRVYEHDDPCLPDYGLNKIPLELRPIDAEKVQYIPCEIIPGYCPDGDGEPGVPSTIWGAASAQSLPFATKTDLKHKDRESDERHFMVDTGAQITVISEAQAIDIELLAYPNDFAVEIVGVTGGSVIAPGWYVDEIEVSASPMWIKFTHVPVVMLDVDSPEGGMLHGILGMNLFVDMDFYLQGGGLTGMGPPFIKYEFLPAHLIGDIAPYVRDGVVDLVDLSAFAEAWLTTPLSARWNSRADMVADAVIDFKDFAVLAGNWGAEQ